MKDSLGATLTLWPIAIAVGNTNASNPLVFTAEIPAGSTNVALKATPDTRGNVFAKRTGDAGWVNISTAPNGYPLAGVTGHVEFQAYLEAVGPVSGMARVPINVILGSSHSAGWLA